MRAIAKYGYRRPGTVLILTPTVWEQRLTTSFCMDLNVDDCYVAVESREALGEWSSNCIVATMGNLARAWRRATTLTNQQRLA